MRPLPFKRPRALLENLATLSAGLAALRPGASVPGSTPPFLAAPPVSTARSRNTPPSTQLRRSLHASTAEGVVAEVVSACSGGAVLTGWALYLGCSASLVALLTALPFVAQLVQFPAAWATARLGRKRVAVAAVSLSRQVYLALLPLPFVRPSPAVARGVLLAVAGSAALLGVVGNNAWVAWMGDLVPASLRGRYFGRRTAACTLGGTVAAMAAGGLLDHARARGVEGAALAFLAALACASGALTTVLMLRQHEPHPNASRTATEFRPRAALAALSDRAARRLLAYQTSWNAASGVVSGMYTVYMLRHLGMGFAAVALYGAGVAGARVLAAPWWGRGLDRVGSRPVLMACSSGLALLPLLWLLAAPGRLWPVALEAGLSGALWGGHGLATFALPLAVAPRGSRPYYLAAFAMAAGLAYALAASAGAGVLALAGDGGFRVLFGLSATLRLGAAVLSARVLEPGRVRRAFS